VKRRGDQAICEVRQFENSKLATALSRMVGPGALSPRDIYGTQRFALVEKAEQLRPFAGLGIPLIIALSNPLGVLLGLDQHHVEAAMFGNPGVAFLVDPKTGGKVEGDDPIYQLQEYGAFRTPIFEDGSIVGYENKHLHVSAVAIVCERTTAEDWREEIKSGHEPADESRHAALDASLAANEEIARRKAAGEEPHGAYQWIELYEVDPEEAAPVPSDWFNGPRDKRFGFSKPGSYGPLEGDN
jgi:hypothetical protein